MVGRYCVECTHRYDRISDGLAGLQLTFRRPSLSVGGPFSRYVTPFLGLGRAALGVLLGLDRSRTCG